ncbi:MAG: hypothetical protein QN193_03660 [Armatimonadota bacterium]|nr:hypothetical protein [Armatimonadota bacterium]MDR7444324.1 hypothetical protein [Armatimonadota bacterium]MDR7569685.1 hypothetical protein [Armatimonadota bacterium]MDR7614811.1 hypothetical protein [Armatimonadota bacterium]
MRMVPGKGWPVLVLGVLAGTAAGLVWAGAYGEAIIAALVGPAPKFFWHASRATGGVAYALLWMSVCLGLLQAARLVRGPACGALVEIHRFVSGLGLGFSILHALLFLGDRSLRPRLAEVLLPFGFAPYRPVEVGLGQMALWTALLVYGSWYMRRRMGHRAWRRIHYAAFGAYLLATVHAVGAGTDVPDPVFGGFLVGTAALAYTLFLARVWRKTDARRTATDPPHRG